MQRSFLWLLASALLLGWMALGVLTPVGEAAPPSTGEITGTVLADGVPLGGAKVQLQNDSGGIAAPLATTNSSGQFRFRKVAAGNYSVSAAKFGSPVCHGSAVPVTVTAGQTSNVTVNVTCEVFPP